jgi:hypothetical protein
MPPFENRDKRNGSIMMRRRGKSQEIDRRNLNKGLDFGI